MVAEDLHDEPDPELVEIFLDEGFDIMESVTAGLQRWMDDVDNSFELEALQRDLHTLKGGARMADSRAIGDLAHELEYLYEGLCAASIGLPRNCSRCCRPVTTVWPRCSMRCAPDARSRMARR